ncbi:DUF1062 domain-containing protein [Culicoidibacter larvae]|uniref:DUF1062 domain-containing protein n=1 Tax=Culicoidibacter larvae TaxID=2579976 RepID=A0A5R8QBK7_9FIRM|nr:DUF1062 domain-containing protein [Culicoidibacter larvae]TLG72492.1 DUF1062 domain-containing protein [Culicoidibacter larvae]
MKTIAWEVTFSGLPKTYKYCKKCKSKTEYISSELFRVNANQKNVDVWLIYRCNSCKSTWNMPIYQRINRLKLEQQELEQLMNNDSIIAKKYAMDYYLLKQQGAAPEVPEFSVNGDMPNGETVNIVLTGEYYMPLKISKIIRRKLGLSTQAYAELIASGMIVSCDGIDLYKGKFIQPTTIIIKT